MKLYEIDEAIRSCIDMETGEIIDTERLHALELTREEKLEGVALWIKEDKADEKALEEAIKEMKSKLDSCQKRIESKKQWLAEALAGRKMKTAKISVYYQTRQSTVVDEKVVDSLPDEFVKVSRSANKTAIAEALENGAVIDGCRIVQNTSMIIR